MTDLTELLDEYVQNLLDEISSKAIRDSRTKVEALFAELTRERDEARGERDHWIRNCEQKSLNHLSAVNERDEARALVAKMSPAYKQWVEQRDRIVGTPCAEIRWQERIRELEEALAQARRAALEEAASVVDKEERAAAEEYRLSRSSYWEGVRDGCDFSASAVRNMLAAAPQPPAQEKDK